MHLDTKAVEFLFYHEAGFQCLPPPFDRIDNLYRGFRSVYLPFKSAVQRLGLSKEAKRADGFLEGSERHLFQIPFVFEPQD